MKKLFLIAFLICLIPVFVFAENRFDNGHVGFFEHTTGGDDEAMDSITSPPDNKIVYIFGTIDGIQSYSVYRFDIDSSATELGQTNIAPGSGTGRWIQQQPFFVFGTAGDLTGITDQAGVVKFTIE